MSEMSVKLPNIEFPEATFVTLGNGMRIVLVPGRHCASVSAGLYVGVGSRHEKKSQSGIAHFLEHMLFGGTTTGVAKRLERKIEMQGGSINAETDFDETQFTVDAPVGCENDAVDVLCDMYLNASFDLKAFNHERDVVVNEVRMGEDSERKDDSYAVWRALFGKTGLTRPIGGTVATVGGLTQGDLVTFKMQNYVPNATSLIVCGNFDLGKMRSRLESRFVGLPRGKLPSFAKVSESCPVVSTLERYGDCAQASYSFNFRTSGWKSIRRRMAGTLFDMIMGGSVNSRLWKNVMIRNRGLAYQISTDTALYAETGVWRISGDCDPAHRSRLTQIIEDTLYEIRISPPTRHELEVAKRGFLGSVCMGLYSPAYWRDMLHRPVGIKMSQIRDALQAVVDVKPDDVFEVAQEWIRDDRRCVEWTMPK